MIRLPQRLLLLPVLPLAYLLSAAPVGACPFCGMQGPTLTGEVAQAKMVLYGSLANPDPKANNGDGATDLVVQTVIKNELAAKKDDPFAGNKKTIRLARYLPVQAKENKYRYLVYCDIFKGKIDPYRTLPILKDAKGAEYLRGALHLKKEPIGKRLRFFFDYLDNSDIEISNDAYKEFGNAAYTDYRDMAKTLPAERLAKWLADEKTPAYRYGLYASLLGHCGTAKHAKLLRAMLDDPAKRLGSGIDGMLAGYVMLEPKEGWAYVLGFLKDSKKEFLLRHAALRTVRFLWDVRPDLVKKKELKKGLDVLLEQNDIADLAVDDLRKRGCWDMTDRVLGLRKNKVYETPIVRRAILRFALGCKDNEKGTSKKAAALAYVEEQRKKDAQMVADAEERLKLEQTPSTPAK